MIVIDASVVVDWVAPGGDPQSAAMTTLSSLVARDEEVGAPRLLFEEVANALITGIRRRRWSGTDADAALRRLADLPVRLLDDGRDRRRAWELSRRYDNHPFYDMLYVALAERTKSRLITADGGLRAQLADFAWVLAPGPLST
ncbi:MAG TPA: type II toxin-antitoxin system VapC family toxin [Candidatus Dormibacteraeota bacterium]